MSILRSVLNAAENVHLQTLHKRVLQKGITDVSTSTQLHVSRELQWAHVECSGKLDILQSATQRFFSFVLAHISSKTN